mgnify:CR=1 FL=1
MRQKLAERRRQSARAMKADWRAEAVATPTVQSQPPEDPRLLPFAVRLRRAGLPDTKAGRSQASALWMGCEAGRIMAGACHADDERSALWDAIQRIRRAYANYDKAMAAPRRHAQSLRIMLPADEMETSADAPPPDFRDEQERYDAAMAGWAEIQSLMSRFGRYAAKVTEDCVVHDLPCSQPEAMMLVLRNVSDAIKKG